jgi:hypothetical protein
VIIESTKTAFYFQKMVAQKYFSAFILATILSLSQLTNSQGKNVIQQLVFTLAVCWSQNDFNNDFF